MAKKLVLVADSTQIATWDECPEKWNLGFRQHLGDMLDFDEPITIGTYGHKLLEVYYKNKHLLGASEAFKLSRSIDIDKTNKLYEKFPLTDQVRAKVKARFADYFMTYGANDYVLCTKPAHTIRTDDFGNPYDCYTDEPIVEKGFSYCLLDTREYLFVLEGKIDLIVDTPMGKAFLDHKWQLRERNLYPKSIQFKNYAMVTGLNLGIINYIRLKDKLDDKTLIRAPIAFDGRELRQWREEVIHYFVQMAGDARRNDYARRWGACSGKFGYTCEFSKLCPEYRNPLLYRGIKSTLIKREEWKPW